MKLFLLTFMPLVAQAADTDIIPRSVNFVIFAAILYFVAFKYVKAIYLKRIDDIQQRLSTLEKEILLSKQSKDDALKLIENANIEAEEIMRNAVAQGDLEYSKIINNADIECVNLENQFQEKCRFEVAMAQKEVVTEVIDELVESKIQLSDKALLSIIEKRVAR